jgi:hypothetical protein
MKLEFPGITEALVLRSKNLLHVLTSAEEAPG